MRMIGIGFGLSLLAVATGWASPSDVSVLFSNAPVTSYGTSVFVVGSIPQLGNWNPTLSTKMVPNGCAGQTCQWSVTIGIPRGTSYEYKFIQRADCALCFGDGANVAWEPGANRTNMIASGPVAPWNGKTVFYLSSWSSVSLLYSNLASGWTNQPMTPIGPGRTNLYANEKIWRADGVNHAGDTNLHFLFYTVVNGTDVYDNAGLPSVDYQTPLDACVAQDGQVFNYWPPSSVSTNWVDSFYITPTNGLVGRTVYVYRPRGYQQNTSKRYPVLYMHDGQVLFRGMVSSLSGYSWGADTNANNLIRFGKMRETIIVGVENDPNNRSCEYSPSLLGCTNYCASPLGAKYASFLIDQLKPLIDANYRTLTDADNTGVMGSSMGGLISAYLGWTFTNTFHKVGAMSSAFCVCYPMAAVDSPRTQLRLYLDSGDLALQGSSTGVGCLVNDDLLNTVGERDVLINKGFVLNENLDHTIGYGQWHSELWWAVRLPRCFTFLFPTSDEPNTVLDTAVPPRVTSFLSTDATNTITWTSYRLRRYALEGSTNQLFSSSMSWSNLVTTAPESLWWNYPSATAPSDFHFFRVRELSITNWPN